MSGIDTTAGEPTLLTNPEGYVIVENPGIIHKQGGIGLYFVVTDGVVEVAQPGQEYVPANAEEVNKVFHILSVQVDASKEKLSIEAGTGVGRIRLEPVPQRSKRDTSSDLEVLTAEEQQYRKKRLLSDLRNAADAEAKMDILAAFLDRYGFDAFIGLIPHVGDGAVTAIAGIITFWQGMKAGVGIKSGAKMGAYHLADFLVGQIPVLGEFADLFIKPNEYAAGEVAHRLRALLDEARAKGVPEEEIQEALRGGKEFKELWNGRMAALKAVKGALMKALHIKEKPRLEDHGGKAPDSPEASH